MIESLTDQPLTRPVALRRNSVGVSPPTAPAAMLASKLGFIRNCYWPAPYSRGGLRSAIDQKVFGNFALLRVQFQHSSLQDPVAVNAAGIDGHRPAHPLDATALVNVAVHRQHRLVLQDRVPDRSRAPRSEERRVGKE